RLRTSSSLAEDWAEPRLKVFGLDLWSTIGVLAPVVFWLQFRWTETQLLLVTVIGKDYTGDLVEIPYLTCSVRACLDSVVNCLIFQTIK
ncbi:hypothetical protein U1Q18_027879, partial [Sarracenia purpurea var. burkii]